MGDIEISALWSQSNLPEIDQTIQEIARMDEDPFSVSEEDIVIAETQRPELLEDIADQKQSFAMARHANILNNIQERVLRARVIEVFLSSFPDKDDFVQVHVIPWLNAYEKRGISFQGLARYMEKESFRKLPSGLDLFDQLTVFAVIDISVQSGYINFTEGSLLLKGLQDGSIKFKIASFSDTKVQDELMPMTKVRTEGIKRQTSSLQAMYQPQNDTLFVNSDRFILQSRNPEDQHYWEVVTHELIHAIQDYRLSKASTADEETEAHMKQRAAYMRKKGIENYSPDSLKKESARILIEKLRQAQKVLEHDGKVIKFYRDPKMFGWFLKNFEKSFWSTEEDLLGYYAATGDPRLEEQKAKFREAYVLSDILDGLTTTFATAYQGYYRNAEAEGFDRLYKDYMDEGVIPISAGEYIKQATGASTLASGRPFLQLAKMPFDQMNIRNQIEYGLYKGGLCFTMMVLFEIDPQQGTQFFFDKLLPFMNRFHPRVFPYPEMQYNGWISHKD